MMRHILTVIKVVAAIAVLVVVVASIYFVQSTLKKMQSTSANDDIAAQLERDDLPQIQPGETAFTRAKEYLAIGDLKSAQQKLLYITNYHPQTRSASESRRILGEMNLDRELSLENMENKKVHKVKRGESFLGIANKYQTTLDAIMFFNGLTGLNRLYPGDELVLMPLNFRVVVDLEFKTLTVVSNGKFVKEYLLEGIDAPYVKKSFITQIGGKTGYKNGKSIAPSKSAFRSADKVLSLKGSPLQITTKSEKENADGSKVLRQGFFLAQSDLEELVMILRVGNEIEIRPASS